MNYYFTVRAHTHGYAYMHALSCRNAPPYTRVRTFMRAYQNTVNWEMIQ